MIKTQGIVSSILSINTFKKNPEPYETTHFYMLFLLYFSKSFFKTVCIYSFYVQQDVNSVHTLDNNVSSKYTINK